MVGHLAVGAAALLHDIGKLYQRAYWQSPPDGLVATHHAAYTAWFIERHAALFANAGLEPDWLAKTAAKHHEGWHERPQYQPTTAAQWCVALADTYASRERGEAEGNDARHVTAVPLKSVFANLRAQGVYGRRDWGYSMVEAGQEVGLKLGTAYPQERPNVSKDTYWRLAERLDRRLGELAKHNPLLEAPLQRIMSAGGKFYLLLPNSEVIQRALEEVRREWEKWA